MAEDFVAAKRFRGKRQTANEIRGYNVEVDSDETKL
jgi:hypothetical protein